jgi:hypothetical protein
VDSHDSVAVSCRVPVSDGGAKSDVDVLLAPILAMQIESELAVAYDSESPLPMEHNDQPHAYSQNVVAHHPLLLQVRSTFELASFSCQITVF